MDLNFFVSEIRKRTDFVPRMGIVLGSGLGAFAAEIETESAIPYEEIPSFPTSTVDGHRGRFVFGYMEGVPLVLMEGRVHYYEGYSMEEVVLPVRLMGKLGAETIILTNAAGGIDERLSAGSLMLIADHISSFVPSPLRGKNDDSLGVRFPDMTNVYSPALRRLAKEAAEKLGIPLPEGVYLQVSGPNYETPAEIRAFRTLGAACVGMSTAVEAMAARHMGLSVLGISCISNMAAGISPSPLSHEEVRENAERAGADFKRLLKEIIKKAGKENE
ncbi:MAG: purine-nucleoside phosphorylase [Clostridia bacterium]|nr:purine-nucleoside phosphorylase [Clostridia bacterium]